MSGHRILAIARKQFLTLRHDPRTLALMVLAPIMAMLIFGFAFGQTAKHVAVIVVNQDTGDVARKIIDNIDTTALNLTTRSDLVTATQQVDAGHIVAVISFPASFTADSQPTMKPPTAAPATFHALSAPSQPTVIPPVGTSVQLYLDTTNEQLAAVVERQLAHALQATAKELGATSAIAIDQRYAFPKAKDATATDTLVPGIIAFAITVFTTLLTLLAFVSERTSGTLDRMRVTPVTEAEIVLGYELAFGIIAALQGALVLAVAILVYHVLVVGSVALAALVVILTAIDAQAIGIVVSAAARRESQAVQFLPFIIFPTFLLSGIFVAVSSLPSWLRPLSYLLPPTWAIEALRNVLLRGWGFAQIWPNLAVLLGFAVLFSTSAILGLKASKR